MAKTLQEIMALEYYKTLKPEQKAIIEKNYELAAEKEREQICATLDKTNQFFLKLKSEKDPAKQKAYFVEQLKAGVSSLTARAKALKAKAFKEIEKAEQHKAEAHMAERIKNI
jgi:hypothetical protein